jgi:hypothetical protein
MSVESSATVFRGVRVFDGRNSALTGPSDVVVRDATIESVGLPRPSRCLPGQMSGSSTAAAAC